MIRKVTSGYRNRRRLAGALRGNVTVGGDFHLGDNCTLWAPRKLLIGKHVHLGSNVRIEVDGELGDGLLIANNVSIVGRSDHDATQAGSSIEASKWVGDDPDRLSLPVRICSDIWLGLGAIILSGVEIGDSAIIGAGSVVTQDVPSNAVVVGNPARTVRDRFSPTEFERHWKILAANGYRKLSK